MTCGRPRPTAPPSRIRPTARQRADVGAFLPQPPGAICVEGVHSDAIRLPNVIVQFGWVGMNSHSSRGTWTWFVRSSGSWRSLVASVAALFDAERALRRLVDARVTVTEMPAGPCSVVTEPTGSAEAGSPVPRQVTNMAATTGPRSGTERRTGEGRGTAVEAKHLVERGCKCSRACSPLPLCLPSEARRSLVSMVIDHSTIASGMAAEASAGSCRPRARLPWNPHSLCSSSVRAAVPPTHPPARLPLPSRPLLISRELNANRVGAQAYRTGCCRWCARRSPSRRRRPPLAS